VHINLTTPSSRFYSSRVPQQLLLSFGCCYHGCSVVCWQPFAFFPCGDQETPVEKSAELFFLSSWGCPPTPRHLQQTTNPCLRQRSQREDAKPCKGHPLGWQGPFCNLTHNLLCRKRGQVPRNSGRSTAHLAEVPRKNKDKYRVFSRSTAYCHVNWNLLANCVLFYVVIPYNCSSREMEKKGWEGFTRYFFFLRGTSPIYAVLLP